MKLEEKNNLSCGINKKTSIESPIEEKTFEDSTNLDKSSDKEKDIQLGDFAVLNSRRSSKRLLAKVSMQKQ